MITGTVMVDLTFDPFGLDAPIEKFAQDRRALHVLELCPDGARVVVDIGARRYVTEDAARWLHDHDHRLEIEIRGQDPRAVTCFVRAARSGDWQAVA